MPAKNLTPSITEAKVLVQSYGDHAYTTSLAVAARFKKHHKDVIRKIERYQKTEFWERNFAPSDYIDSRGKTRPMYELTKDGCVKLIMGFTGKDADKWQNDYIERFNAMEAALRERYANPPRTDILRDKRKAHHPMMDALIEAREDIGKDTGTNNYMSENKLCNWAVTGQFGKIDEKTISNEDAQLLADVRKRNEAYLLAGLDYKTRKAKLQDFALRRRTKLLTTKV